MPFTLKHILGLSLIAALAFVSFGLYDCTLQRNWAEEQLTGELQGAAQAQAQQLSANLSRLWRTVETVANEASTHPADLRQSLIEAHRFNPALTLLGLANVDGTVTAGTDGDEISVAQAPWFAGALRNPIVKAVTSEAGGYSATIVLAKPLKNKDGITVAVLFALAATGDFMTSAVGPADWSSKNTFAAVDGRQLMVWRNAEPSFKPQQSLEASASRSIDYSEWFTATAQVFSGGAFPETGWSVTVARAKAEIDQRLASEMLKLWAGCFAIACLMILAAAAWTAWLAAPLTTISRFAAVAAEGNKVDPLCETRFREATILCSSLVELWTSLRRVNAPKPFRLVASKADVDGESDLIFDDLVLYINALMDQECLIQPAMGGDEPSKRCTCGCPRPVEEVRGAQLPSASSTQSPSFG
jgi:hypothetical protein